MLRSPKSWCPCRALLTIGRPSMRAIANQHPPMYQLTFISIGWVMFSHPTHDPALTNIVPQ